jgi:hypothetical protein
MANDGLKRTRRESSSQSISRLSTKKKKVVGGVMKFDLTYAKHDPAHCLAPGLFRSLRRG